MALRNLADSRAGAAPEQTRWGSSPVGGGMTGQREAAFDEWTTRPAMSRT